MGSVRGTLRSGRITEELQLGHLLVAAVFIVVALVYSVSPVITNYDSYSAFPTAVSIVNRQNLSLDPYRHIPEVANSYTVAHTNGRLLTAYPWPVAIFATPAVVVIDALHVAGGPSADSIVSHHPQIGSLVQLWSASVVTALACAALALLAYRRLRGSPRARWPWAFGCGLIFAFATSAWSTASRALWQHGPSILFLSLGLLALDRLFPREGEGSTKSSMNLLSLGAGLAFAAAVTMRPTNVIALLLVGILLAWKARSALPAFIGGIFIVFIPWAAITYASYGTLLQPYDQANKLGLVSTFFESIAANLVSPSRGLIIFSPVVLAAPAGLVIAYRRRTIGPLEILSAVAAVSYIVVLGLWTIWWAGNSFGPRFTTEALPFLFVLALPFVDWLRSPRAENTRARSTHYRAVAIGAALLLLISVVVNAQGGLLRSSLCWNGPAHTPQNVDNDPHRVWSWSDPQFDYGIRALASEHLHAVMHCPATV
jgi:hypothetical protein